MKFKKNSIYKFSYGKSLYRNIEWIGEYIGENIDVIYFHILNGNKVWFYKDLINDIEEITKDDIMVENI